LIQDHHSKHLLRAVVGHRVAAWPGRCRCCRNGAAAERLAAVCGAGLRPLRMSAGLKRREGAMQILKGSRAALQTPAGAA
jgi:hypothetical protein